MSGKLIETLTSDFANLPPRLSVPLFGYIGDCFKMLLGRLFVDFDLELRSKGLRCFKATPFSSSKVAAFFSSLGSATEYRAALKVAIRIGFSDF